MDIMSLGAVLSLKTSGFETAMAKAESRFSKFGGTLKKGLSVATKAVAASAVAAGAAATAFVVSSVKEGAAFDKSMSQVAATMGRTTESMTEMSNFARKMGQTTAFSATEAAEALNYMALAGYDDQKSMAMLPKVLDLAAAGGIGLASASDMVTDASSALGLSMEQTEALVDQMAKTSSKSNTSVAQLGEAILSVGGTAKMMKGGTTELNAVLGVLADNGIKGSEGGRALRNVLLALSAPTDKAAKQLKKLGVEVFDSSGNMRELPNIMQDLNVAMEGMTDEQKTNILSDIFNKNDMKSINALLGTTTDRWAELVGEIVNSKNAASQMAETQLDNLPGDITKFKSALSEAKITIAEGLQPTLRAFVQAGTNWVTELTDGFKEGGLKGAVEALKTSLEETKKEWEESDNPLLQAAAKILETVTSISETIVGLMTDWDTTIASMKSGDSEGVRLLAEALETVKAAIEVIKAGFNDGIPGAIKKLEELDTPLSKIAAGALQTLYDVCNFFVENVGIEGTIKGIAGAFLLFNGIKISASLLTFLSRMKTLFGGGGAAVAAAGGGSAAGNAVAGAAAGGTAAKTGLLGKIGAFLSTTGAKVLGGLGLGAYLTLKPNENTHDEIGNSDLFDENGNPTDEYYHQQEVNNNPKWATVGEKETSYQLSNEQLGMRQAIAEQVQENRPELEQAQQMFTEALSDSNSSAVGDMLADLAERYKTAFEDMGDEPVIEGLINNLSDETGDALSKMLEDISNGEQLDPQGMVELAENIKDELDRILTQNPAEAKTEPKLDNGAQAFLQQQLNNMNLNVPVLPTLGGFNLGVKPFGKHAKGLHEVPYDNYPALLHRGEEVLTASQARKKDGGGLSNQLVDAIQGLKQDFENMRIVVGKRTLGRTMVDYGGSRMESYIGGSENRFLAGYGER